MSHVQLAHPNYSELSSEDSATIQTHLDRYFEVSKASKIYGWIDLVINGSLLFSYIETSAITKHIRHEAFSRKTLMK